MTGVSSVYHLRRPVAIGTCPLKLEASPLVLSAISAMVLLLMPVSVAAQDSGKPTPIVASSFSDDPNDGPNRLAQAEARRVQKTGLFEVQPLGGFRDLFSGWNDSAYAATGLRFTLGIHHASQFGSPTVTDGNGDRTDESASGIDIDFNTDWALFNRGAPNEFKIFANVEGRFDYGTVGAQNLGFANIGAAGGSANTFSAYDPNFILRQGYFTQGGPEAGWSYRIGKLTVDGALGSSRHINPNATFLSNVATGYFAVGAPDSGLGIAGTYTFNESWSVMGVVSDANADRYNWGDLDAGDLWRAVELRWNTPDSAPIAADAKVAYWYTDATKDGVARNFNTGKAGGGMVAILETELADDGRPVILARYARSFDGAALADEQAGLSFLLYQPIGALDFDSDVLGAAVNWQDPAADGARDETQYEVFYRFPVFPQVDATVTYQHIENPAYASEFDSADTWAIRLTTTF